MITPLNILEEECDELSDDIFLLAQQYARSACDAFKEQRT